MKHPSEINWIVRENEFLRKLPETWDLSVHGQIFCGDNSQNCLNKFLEFKNLRYLNIHSPTHLDFILPLCKNLEELMLIYTPLLPDDVKWIHGMKSITHLSIEIQSWDPAITDYLGTLKNLQDLRIWTKSYTSTDLSPLKKLSSLKNLEVVGLHERGRGELCESLGSLGLLERKTYNVTIGNWQDSEPASRTPEYRCQELNDGYPIPLRWGDQLEIFDSNGTILFSGTIDYPNSAKFLPDHWHPATVDPSDWYRWFSLNYQARITIWQPKSDYSVTLL